MIIPDVFIIQYRAKIFSSTVAAIPNDSDCSVLPTVPKGKYGKQNSKQKPETNCWNISSSTSVVVEVVYESNPQKDTETQYQKLF